jgi:hypothetical protein
MVLSIKASKQAPTFFAIIGVFIFYGVWRYRAENEKTLMRMIARPFA